MSEIIVRYKDGNDHMAVRGGEYVQDLVRCKECKHWCKGDDVYGICYRCPNTRQMRHDDFCSYGERSSE